MTKRLKPRLIRIFAGIIFTIVVSCVASFIIFESHIFNSFISKVIIIILLIIFAVWACGFSYMYKKFYHWLLVIISDYDNARIEYVKDVKDIEILKQEIEHINRIFEQYNGFTIKIITLYIVWMGTGIAYLLGNSDLINKYESIIYTAVAGIVFVVIILIRGLRRSRKELASIKEDLLKEMKLIKSLNIENN